MDAMVVIPFHFPNKDNAGVLVIKAAGKTYVSTMRSQLRYMLMGNLVVSKNELKTKDKSSMRMTQKEVVINIIHSA